VSHLCNHRCHLLATDWHCWVREVWDALSLQLHLVLHLNRKARVVPCNVNSVRSGCLYSITVLVQHTSSGSACPATSTYLAKLRLLVCQLLLQLLTLGNELRTNIGL
jgi:hypothetical protein